MSKLLVTQVLGLPFKNFKQRMRITNQFEKKYHIEVLENKDASGLL